MICYDILCYNILSALPEAYLGKGEKLPAELSFAEATITIIIIIIIVIDIIRASPRRRLEMLTATARASSRA